MVSFSLPRNPVAPPLYRTSLISLFKFRGLSSVSILTSRAKTPEVIKLSSTSNSKLILTLPSPITFRNSFPSLSCNFACAFLGLIFLIVPGTSFLTFLTAVGSKGRTPNLFKKLSFFFAVGLILHRSLSAFSI